MNPITHNLVAGYAAILCSLALCRAADHTDGTGLLADFENGLDPTFCVNASRAKLDPKNSPDDVRIVPGRFGHGVHIARSAPMHALSYDVSRVLTGEAGTIEFWYKPDWDCDTILDDGPDFLKGKPVSAKLFTTEHGGHGISLYKNQYNVLVFVVTRRYRTICNVMYPARRAFDSSDRWYHIAVAWDQTEARLFADGRLLAVSDSWDLDYFAPALSLAGSGYTSGAFDDLRVSSHKRYVSSFPVPTEPFPVPERSTPTAVRTSQAAAAQQVGQTLFTVDFGQGLVANSARGNARGRSNRELTFDRFGESSCVRLRTQDGTVGDTLCYESDGNLHPALGSVDILFRLAEDAPLPATLFDCAHVLSWYGGRTGMRLLLNSEQQLEWQCLHNGQTVDRVVSAPLELAADQDCVVGLSWANSTIALSHDGRQLVRRQGCAIPARLGRYMFFGSNNLGTLTLDGWLGRVHVSLTPEQEAQ